MAGPIKLSPLLTLAVLLLTPGCRDATPTGSDTTPTAPVRVFTDQTAFDAATTGLGTPTVVDLDELNAEPQNNTIAGRAAFDDNHYAANGFTFSNPAGRALYVAPGGLFWNATNSLSVYRFPFDTTKSVPYSDDDDLVLRLSAGCTAIGFTLVDNATRSTAEFIQFLDPSGAVIRQVGLPADYAEYRAFIGIVGADPPVAEVRVFEDEDGDDVNYDEFRCFRP